MTVIEGRLTADGRGVRLDIRRGRIASIKDTPGAGPCWISPGFVDLQVNGYGGLDFNRDDLDVGTVTALVENQWRQGVTALCPTLVSAPEERLTGALSVIAQARRADPLVRHAIPCAHVEGPYLCAEDGPRGAHDLGALRLPDVDELERWQGASDRLVGIVTLAPELPGAVAYTRAASGGGVIVAIGHSAARAEQVTQLVDAGARLSTHLGNGCHLVLRRHPNQIWAQLADDRLSASFIADGHHLPAATLKAMVRAKTVERSLLVSDAAALAGCPPGRYQNTTVGGDVTVSDDGRLSITGTELLAGSARNLPECFSWAVAHTGVGVAAAAAMAATNPCRLLGLTERGDVHVGACADLTVFELDEQKGVFRLDLTLVAGEIVARAPSPVSLIAP
jgi:N-acetylglucosamine-6-phosphate deacetylase